MEEWELRERVNPVPRTTSTTTSGGDEGSAILQQQLECNNNWNGTTIGMKPNNSPKNRPLFTRILHSIFVVNPSIYHFILNFSYSLTKKNFANFPGRPCCDKAQQNGRKKGRNEEKYCCTIPLIGFARFRLHLNRPNKFKNYLP